MSCRRVLSSTPLLVRGSETVWGSGERKLTNKKYKYCKLLESGKRVVGPVSTQALVGWRLGEWGDEFSGVYTDANIIMGAELADLFFYCWYSKALADDRIWNVPGGHSLLAAILWIENALKFWCLNLRSYPRVECRMSNGFEYRLVDEEFVVGREVGLVSK
jgi:hypothetical protein